MITLVGLGVARGDLTLNAVEALVSGEKVLLRTEVTPAADFLREKGVPFETLDDIYEENEDFDEVNDAAAEVLDWESAVASLDLPEDHRLSACFLGNTVLELTGRDQDNAWFAFLSQLRREMPVVQAELYEDSEGQVRSLSSLSPERQDAIRRWRCWSYYKLQQKELR